MQSFKWGEQAPFVLENSSITLVETPMDLEKPLIQFPKGASSQTPQPALPGLPRDASIISI